MLSVVGGLAGTVIATAGVQVVKPLAVYGLQRFEVRSGPAVLDRSVLPRIDEVTINGGVFTFVLAIAVVTGVLFGIAPALRLSRVERVAAHADASSTSGRSPRRQHGLGHARGEASWCWRRLLVVTVLLAHPAWSSCPAWTSGSTPACSRSSLWLRAPTRPPKGSRWRKRVSDGSVSLPTVTAAGFTDRPPFSRMGPSWQGPVVPVEREWRGMDRADMAMIRSVSRDYLLRSESCWSRDVGWRTVPKARCRLWCESRLRPAVFGERTPLAPRFAGARWVCSRSWASWRTSAPSAGHARGGTGTRGVHATSCRQRRSGR